jgi:hypothetical protein
MRVSIIGTAIKLRKKRYVNQYRVRIVALG